MPPWMSMDHTFTLQYDYNTLEDLKNDWIRLQNPTTSSPKSSKLPCLSGFSCPKYRKIRNRKKKRREKKTMATNFLSTANPFLLSSSSSSSLSMSLATVTPTYVYHPIKCSVKSQSTLCKAVNQPAPSVTKRGLSISFLSSFMLSLAGKGCFDANAAILEADDDVELLEKVKKDRKKRLERQGVINSSTKETAYLQDLVYKLSEVGQAIENNDLPKAGSVFGKGTDTDWVQKATTALTKLSSSPEEKTEVDTFNSSLASLISSVARNDVESSKLAFVSSASAFEKWTSLTGLVVQLKGL